MDIKKRQEYAKKVFNAVKERINAIKAANKLNKEKPYCTPRKMVADLNVGMKYGWLNAKGDCYQITLIGERNNDDEVLVDEIVSVYDLNEIISEVVKLVNEQKKVKGWSTLNVAYDTAHFGNGYVERSVKYPAKITLCEKPCKEYTALQKFINKNGISNLGWKRPMNLGNYELFCSAMGGKRGVLWDEYGDRLYLDNKPNKCQEILDNLRAKKGARDTMTCTRGEENWIDPIDRKYSELHEVECDGEKRSYLQITIKTPTGRPKYDIKIY
jgi:hypothetical protein